MSVFSSFLIFSKGEKNMEYALMVVIGIAVFFFGYLLGYVPGKRNYEEGERLRKEGMGFLDRAKASAADAGKELQEAREILAEAKRINSKSNDILN